MNTEIKTLKAKDLIKEYPRSPRELLAGYVLAARVLDKCRAAISGTLGEYHFDCPLDRYFFQFAGIDAESFRAFVATGADDGAVAVWIEEHATPRSRIEVIKWNNEMREKRLGETCQKTSRNFSKATSRSSCPQVASFTAGLMFTTSRSSGFDPGRNAVSQKHKFRNAVNT